MSVSLSRLVVVNPVTLERLGELPEAAVSTVGQTLNDFGALTFTLPTDATASNRLLKTSMVEIHLYVGQGVYDIYVPTGRRDTASGVEYSCPTADWWFSKRTIGRIPKQEYLINGVITAGGPAPWRGINMGRGRPAHVSISKEHVLAGRRSLRVAVNSDTHDVRDTEQTDGLFDGNTITLAGRKAFRQLARGLPRGAAALTVTGHTDNTASSVASQATGLARAEAAARVIRRVRPDLTVNAASAGETNPVATNATPEGRARNRRVVVTGQFTPAGALPAQCATQTVTIPAENRGRLATVVANVFIPADTYAGPAKGGLGLEVLLEDGKRKVCPVNDETPKDTWVRMEVRFRIPAGTVRTAEVRLYTPQGEAFWDQISLTVNEALWFNNADQIDMFKALVRHAQDETMGHQDLSIKVEGPKSGILRDRKWYFHERRNVLEILREFATLHEGFEWSLRPRANGGRAMVAHYPRKGREHVDLVLTEDNTVDLGFEENGEHMAHVVIVQAEGETSARDEAHAARWKNGPRLESVYSATPGSAVSSLKEQAHRGVDRHSTPTVLPTLRVSVKTIGGLRVIQTGDILPIRLHRTWKNWSGRVRVVSTSWSPDGGYIDLTVAPWDEWSE